MTGTQANLLQEEYLALSFSIGSVLKISANAELDLSSCLEKLLEIGFAPACQKQIPPWNVEDLWPVTRSRLHLC